MADHMRGDTELSEREAWLCAAAARETTGPEYSRIKALALEAVPSPPPADPGQLARHAALGAYRALLEMLRLDGYDPDDVRYPEGDFIAAMASAIAAALTSAREPLQAEVARLREALETAESFIRNPHTEADLLYIRVVLARALAKEPTGA